MTYGIVIPNRFPDIFQPLARSLRYFEPKADVVIVADGHLNGYGYEMIPYPYEFFSFSKAANLGINHFKDRNVFLINDDTVLLEPETFSRLDKIGTEHGCGVLSPLIRGCAGLSLQRWYLKHENWWMGDGYLPIANTGPGLCYPFVWLNRKALDCVGLFNEDITGYGFQDNDLNSRMIAAGYPVSVVSSIVVQHGTGGPELAEGRGLTWSCSFVRRTWEW